jgi:hypothetical protein
MPDDWEVANGLNPIVPDDSGDADHDGSGNLAEYYFGTDPQAAESSPRVSVNPVGNKVRLVFSCAGGRHYYLERSENPVSGPWTSVLDAVSPGGLQFYDQGIAGYNQLYFRVRITP